MACLSELLSAGIIEKDINNDVLWTWTYPAISSDLKDLLINKCGLESSSESNPLIAFYYCHHQESWFYLRLTDVCDITYLPKVRHFILVLQAKDFNPEKYEHLSQMLSKTYSKTGNPAEMLNLYLSVLVKGMCSTKDNGTFAVKQFDQVNAYTGVPIKDVVKTFGLETILIYTALLLKKRIIVYHHRLDALLWFVRSLPALVWHRQDWNIMYPFMNISKTEMQELSMLSTFIAGFRDAAIEKRVELYDIFVNLPAVEITIAAHSKEIFNMTKTHKDIAVFMTRQAENSEINDKIFIKELLHKTNDLLKSLHGLAEKDKYGQEIIKNSILKEKGFHISTETFLRNLAVAEGILFDSHC